MGRREQWGGVSVEEADPQGEGRGRELASPCQGSARMRHTRLFCAWEGPLVGVAFVRRARLCLHASTRPSHQVCEMGDKVRITMSRPISKKKVHVQWSTVRAVLFKHPGSRPPLLFLLTRAHTRASCLVALASHSRRNSLT